ncbi:MAG: hypothetical protein RQ752_06400 [Thermohalobaculum sp.]|nr:hypothetical protein [Thermohalobaculum sp.]
MAHELKTTTVRVSKSFCLPGVPGPLAAGSYVIEWRQHFLDDVSMPEAAATEVHLHLGAQAADAVVTIPWAALRTVLLHDRAQPQHPHKVPVAALADDPLIRLVMSSDGVTDHALRRTLRAARMRREGRVALGGGAARTAAAQFPGHHGPGTRTPAPL